MVPRPAAHLARRRPGPQLPAGRGASTASRCAGTGSGWAPDAWDALTQGLGLSETVLKGTGLGYLNSIGRRQDFFRARILFPIFDVQGDPVAFGGRKMPDADGPKYLNISETRLYQKSKVLYGLNWSKDDAVRADEVIICEGYTDVIGFASVGLPRAVAPCGTSLTEDHVRVLQRFAKTLVLAFDPDAAGQAAAERVYEWERKLEIDVAVADLPVGQDPGDLARSDPDRLRAAISGRTPFLGFRVGRALGAGRMDTPEGRARTAEAALVVVAEHPDELVRDQYVMEIADRCRLDVERLRAVLRAGPRVQPEPTRRAGPPTRRAESNADRMLRLAVDPTLGDEALGLLDDVLFTEDHHLRAWHTLRDADGDLHAALAAADPDVADLLARLAVEDTVDTPRDIRRALCGMRSSARSPICDAKASEVGDYVPYSDAVVVVADAARGDEGREPAWPGCRGPVASLALRTVDGDGMSDLVSAAVPEGADQSVQRLLERGRAAGGRVTLHEVFEVLEFDDVSLDRRAEIVELLARHGIELDESEEIAADPIADLATVPTEAVAADPTVGAMVAEVRAGADADGEPETEEGSEDDRRSTGRTASPRSRSSSSARRRPASTSASVIAACGPRRRDAARATGGSADSVRVYLKEIGRVPLLTAPEEKWLAQRFEAGTAMQAGTSPTSTPPASSTSWSSPSGAGCRPPPATARRPSSS